MGEVGGEEVNGAADFAEGGEESGAEGVVVEPGDVGEQADVDFAAFG